MSDEIRIRLGPKEDLRLAVLASGQGSTLEALLDDANVGSHICLVISNNSDSGALRKAREYGVTTAHISARTHPDGPDSEDEALVRALQQHQCNRVLLAGYMKRVGKKLLKAFAGQVYNTHPALLPKYGGQGMYGSAVHQAVMDSGDDISGASLHIVTAEYDKGPVVAQTTKVDIHRDDDLASLRSRVQVAEKTMLKEFFTSLITDHTDLKSQAESEISCNKIKTRRASSPRIYVSKNYKSSRELHPT